MEYIADIIFIGVYGIISFLLAFLCAPIFIQFLYKNKVGKQIRDIATDGKTSPMFHALHKHKSGTPTMGGILIWGVTLLTVLLSRIFSYFGIIDRSLLQRKETYLPLAVLLSVAVLGAIDDIFNIKGLGTSKGINVRPKFFWLALLAAAGAWWFYFKLGYDVIHIPRLGDFTIGIWYIPLFIFVFVTMTHAVNITDGLDGLAGGLLILAFGAFAVIAYAKGLIFLTALCSVLVGALLAFLWFNVSPAQFFMGETGSLALGATLGVIGLLTNSILPLLIISGIFLAEVSSSAIQLLSKRLFGKKVFLIAPLHHHFEAKGWPEHNIVFRFWIIGGILAIVGVIVGLIGMG